MVPHPCRFRCGVDPNGSKAARVGNLTFFPRRWIKVEERRSPVNWFEWQSDASRRVKAFKIQPALAPRECLGGFCYNRTPMRAFQVSLNGKKLCLAGIGDDGVLTAIVTWVKGKGKGDLFLEVGGLVTPSDEHVSWKNQTPLRLGNTIEIKIIDASRLTPLRSAPLSTVSNG
jgi:hypothetical protein